MQGTMIPWAVVIATCAIAALWDGLWRRIPNHLTLPSLLAGVAWAGYVEGWRGVSDSIIASLLVGFPFVLLFMLSLGGAGDAKLMGAVGAWLGVQDGLTTLLWVVLSGGIIGLALGLLNRRLPQVMLNVWTAVVAVLVTAGLSRKWSDCVGAFPRTANMQWMPYGIPILLGVCLAAGGFRPW